MTMITQHAKDYYVEQIMVLWGRSQPNPKQYRQHLNVLTLKELVELYENLVGGKGE